MRTLYLDCGMGAAGDMLMAALLELCPGRKEEFLEKMNHLGLPGVKVEAEEAVKCGITGTHMNVSVFGEEEESVDVHDHEHHHIHADMAGISHAISHLDLPDEVKQAVTDVYGLIAEAEGHAHGKRIDQIHFHEVGTADAIADITGVCLLLHWLKPERIIASPVHVGSGQVRCAHGILPVPAPATAYILRDVPIYGGQIRGELCTPTGAALLKLFVTEFGEMPVMKVSAIGYGMGKKDFERANCVRALLGETADSGDEVIELNCNVDDMAAEAIGFAQEILLAEGALEIFTTSVGMKKSRPGVLLTCLCRPQDRDKIVRLIFKHTTTIGIRETICKRHVLRRAEHTIETPNGPVREKVSSGYGVTRSKLEYEDLARIAREKGASLAEVRESVGENRTE